MSVIGNVEDWLVATLREAFGERVREVDHKPERMTAEELARILTVAPAIYVAFLGLPRRGAVDGVWIGSFGVFAMAQNASGEQARRRGDTKTIGAYEMAELALRVLDGAAPDVAAGAIEIASIENLYAEAFEKNGRSVYALAAEIPLELPRGVDPAELADFVTFDAAWDIPPHGNVPAPPPPPEAAARDASDLVTLAQ